MRADQEANATDQSDNLGQMNNAESNLEHIAKAGFDILESGMKRRSWSQVALRTYLKRNAIDGRVELSAKLLLSNEHTAINALCLKNPHPHRNSLLQLPAKSPSLSTLAMQQLPTLKTTNYHPTTKSIPQPTQTPTLNLPLSFNPISPQPHYSPPATTAPPSFSTPHTTYQPHVPPASILSSTNLS